jgi:putative ABC transport system ATP-binding protein
MLRAEHLTRIVDGQTIVDQVSVEVRAGEVLGVVGPSGAGKSSFLRLLNRLDEPSAGTVLLEGVDYRQLEPRELRRKVGMVMQRPFLFRGTVLDNLAFGPRQRGEPLSPEDAEALLTRVHLSGWGAREVANLSGGEAQRVSLARALANLPSVLLLDEPTSALDDTSKRAVEELLGEVIRAQKLTCVLVTHDLAQAQRLVDRVLVMENGRAVRVEVVRA